MDKWLVSNILGRSVQTAKLQAADSRDITQIDVIFS
jgi:hypothetical protein